MSAPKVALMLKGMARIDRRSRAARDVLQWTQDLAANPNRVARKTRMDTVARTKLILDDLDAFLLGGTVLFTKRTLARVSKLVDLRQRLAESLDRTMAQLGETKRGQVATDLPDLADVIAAQTNGTAKRATR